MRIPLKDITENGLDLDFTEKDAWVLASVQGVDEEIADEVIIADGRFQTPIHLNCSRCVTPFDLSCSHRFTALYSRDPEMSGISGLKGSTGVAKSTHDESEQDLEITYLTQDFIDLSETLSEQLLLQVPFQPLCQTACKGICQTCGTDLNRGRCACDKVAKQSPFSVLKDFQARKQ